MSDKVEKLTKEESEYMSEIMVTIIQMMAFIPLEKWELMVDTIRNECSRYGAIGILDGISYLKKDEENKKHLKRAEAFLALIRSYTEV